MPPGPVWKNVVEQKIREAVSNKNTSLMQSTQEVTCISGQPNVHVKNYRQSINKSESQSLKINLKKNSPGMGSCTHPSALELVIMQYGADQLTLQSQFSVCKF